MFPSFLYERSLACCFYPSFDRPDNTLVKNIIITEDFIGG